MRCIRRAEAADLHQLDGHLRRGAGRALPQRPQPVSGSAAVIETSDLDYTILRPGWFTHDHEVNYQITQKGEPFRGHDVSLDSLSDLITKLVTTPGLHVRCSLGVSSGVTSSGTRGGWKTKRNMVERSMDELWRM